MTKPINDKYDFFWDMEFESILYVAYDAWEMKHNLDWVHNYPHDTPLSYETRSNEEGWK